MTDDMVKDIKMAEQSLNELIPWKTDIVPRFRSSLSCSTGTERPVRR